MKASANSMETSIKTAMVAALLVFVGVLVFMFMVPVPSLDKAKQAHVQADKRVVAQMLKASQDAKAMEAKTSPLLWNLPLDGVGPAALAQITDLAKSHQVKLNAFRPQRAGDVGGLTQLPFLIGVDGSYPNVVAFVKDIETKGTKLALSQVQLSSSDGTTDKVSASIGVVAYVPSAGGATNG